MLPIEPRGGFGGNEELGAIGVWPGIRHTQGILGMLQICYLILKSSAPDAVPACPIS